MELREFQVSTIAEPAQVKLIRSSKGGYSWELNLHGESLMQCLEKIHNADVLLQERYAGKTTEEVKP